MLLEKSVLDFYVGLEADMYIQIMFNNRALIRKCIPLGANTDCSSCLS